MFMLDIKDIFAAKLANKPIDIRKVKTTEEWIEAVQVLVKCEVLKKTDKPNVFEVQHPLLGRMKKTPEHHGDEITLSVGSFVGVE